MVRKVDNNVDDDPGGVVVLVLGVKNDDIKVLLDNTSMPPQCTNAGFFCVHAKSIIAMLCLKFETTVRTFLLSGRSCLFSGVRAN